MTDQELSAVRTAVLHNPRATGHYLAVSAILSGKTTPFELLRQAVVYQDAGSVTFSGLLSLLSSDTITPDRVSQLANGAVRAAFESGAGFGGLFTMSRDRSGHLKASFAS